MLKVGLAQDVDGDHQQRGACQRHEERRQIEVARYGRHEPAAQQRAQDAGDRQLTRRLVDRLAAARGWRASR